MNGITYRKDFGCWWPDYDHKPEICHARVVRNSSDVEVTAARCKKRRICVQAGGHAGLYPIRLAKLFDTVLTFEPDPHLFACLELNVRDAGAGNIRAQGAALGEKCGEIFYSARSSAGSGRTAETGALAVPMLSIDSLGLEACDALVLDVEGFEPRILAGARETIARFRPVLQLEFLPRSEAELREFMRANKYREHLKVHGDIVLLPA